MSGHSKWSTIKREKAATDQARGHVFTKLGAAITIAVREGGGADPESNFRLRLAVDKARAANMPKDNIERAIERATGKSQEAGLDEVLYEIFAPGGVAVLAQGVTDNKQRTAAEIKNLLHVHGGSLGSAGSVGYLFQKVGEVQVAKTIDFDTLLNMVLEAQGEDLEDSGDYFLVYTKPTDLHKVSTYLQDKTIKIHESNLVYKPTTFVTVEASLRNKIVELLHSLEAQSDIHKVFTNGEFPE